jgi:hypothetical protein
LTPEEHNKYLGISHLIYGGLILALMIFVMAFMAVALSSAPGGPPIVAVGFMWLFIGFVYGLMTVPSLVAGYALLKQRPWAKVAAIIGGVTAAMSFPIGTAVCAYTFWFLFSEPGKYIYDKPRQYALPSGNQYWNLEPAKREDTRYTPPPTPPDWR